MSASSISRTFCTVEKFSETYAKKTNTFFSHEDGVTSAIIAGLVKHKDTYGAPLCPCRFYLDKEAEVVFAYWNCPCIPMRERKECHCMLFLLKNPAIVTTNE